MSNTLELILQGIDNYSPAAINAIKHTTDLQKKLTSAEKEIDKFNGLISKSDSYKKAGENIDALKVKLGEAKKAYSNFYDDKQKADAKISALRDETKNKDTSEGRKKEIKSEIAAKKREIDEIKQKQKEYRDEINKTTKELDKEKKEHIELGTSLRKNGADLNNLSDEQKRFKGNIEDATKAVETQKKAIEAQDIVNERLAKRKASRDAFDKASQKAAFLSMNAQAIGGVSRGIFSTAKIPMQKAITFETAKANLGATIGARLEKTDREELLKPMVVQAMYLAKTKGYSASEVMAGQDIFAKAGLNAEGKNNEVMEAMPTAMAFGKAGDVNMADAAKYLVQSSAIFGSDFKSKGEAFSAISDSLVAGADASLLDVGDFGVAFRYSAEQAKKMGMSIEKTSAWLALLGGKGFTGETAGTGFRSVMSTLVDPKKNAFFRNQLGMKFEQESIVDGKKTKTILPLENILLQLNEKTKKLTDLQRQGIFLKLFEREGAGIAMGLTDAAKATDLQAIAKEAKVSKQNLSSVEQQAQNKQTKDYLSTLGVNNYKNTSEMLSKLAGKLPNYNAGQRDDILKKAFANNGQSVADLIDKLPANFASMIEIISNSKGLTQKKADIKSDTTENKLARLQSAWDIFLANIGDKLVPMLEKITPSLSSLLNTVDNFATKNPMITKMIGGTAAGIGGIGAVAAPILGTLATAQLARGGWGLLRGMLGGGAATVATGAAASAGTSALGVGAASAAGGMFAKMGVSVANLGGKSLPFLGTALNAILSPIGAVVGGVALLAGGAYLVYKNWVPISKWLGEFWVTIQEKWSKATAWIGSIFDKIIGGWNSLTGNTLKSIGNIGGESASSAANNTSIATMFQPGQSQGFLSNLEVRKPEEMRAANVLKQESSFTMPVNINVHGASSPIEIGNIIHEKLKTETSKMLEIMHKGTQNGVRTSNFYDTTTG